MVEDDLSLATRGASDAVVFELIVRRHADDVWRLAFGMLRDRGAAEDVTQETFLKAHRGLADFRGGSSLKTWLMSIAHRTCLDQLRRVQAPLVSLDAVRDRKADEVDLATRIALEAAVAKLPHDERQAFMLVDALGLSREEAAAIVGVPASTLKSRLARAHDRLVAEVGVTTKQKRPRKNARSR